MAVALLLLCVLVSSSIPSSSSSSSSSASLNDTVFAVAVSSVLTAGDQQSVCAHVQKVTQPVTLTVVLDMKTEKTLVLEESVTHDFYRCLSFQVPTVLRKTLVFLEVTLRGQNSSLIKKSKVAIHPPSFIHVVQTDKPIYKPGQTVKFRIVSMDSSFVPVGRVYKVVALQDPNSNRIAQWLNQSMDQGIMDLSHPIITEAEQGTYTITAETDHGEHITHSFDIKQYVLPKYEVKVQLPSVISILDQEVTFRVCGKYTYGKPVIGSVKAEFCRERSTMFWLTKLSEDICRTFELTTDQGGCVAQTVDLGPFGLEKDMYADRFRVSAEMEEFGTGVVLKGAGHSSFSSNIRTVTFEDVPEAYKPGIPFEGKVKVVGPDNKAVPNENVYVSAARSQTLTLNTDSKGQALFSLDTSLWENSVVLMASSRNTSVNEPYVPNLRRPEYRAAHHHVTAFYSKSSSFVKLSQSPHSLPCGGDASVKAHYIIQGVELKKGQEVLDFYFMVMTRGGVVQHGRAPVNVDAGAVNKGEVSLVLVQTSSLAPVAQVVLYAMMPSGEVVADSMDFPVQLCLNNKVSLSFSSIQELPGQTSTLRVAAEPGSLCSIRAIDQSVLLLKKEQELTVDYVYDQLPFQKLSGYSHDVDDFEPYPCFPWPEPRPVEEIELILEDPAPARAKRSFFFGRPEQKDDVYSVFKEIGIKLVTNSDVKKPQNCFIHYSLLTEVDSPMMPMANMMPEGNGQIMRKQDEAKKESIRSFFPETWIWDLVSVGDGGSVSVEKKIPDTITKWAAGAFCVSSAGFGVAPNAGLTVFQPFFISLTLPYSVVRGEVFTLRATVFNYLSKCIMVKVDLSDSDQFTSRTCEGCIYTICLCAEESRTFSWIVTPAALGKVSLKVRAEALNTDTLCGNEVATVPDVGRVDTVIRTLLVEAEGTPQMVSHNTLLCPADGPVEKAVSLLMPEMFVAGSARASVSVVGDVMGRAMKNVHRLLAMPYGCGEQNMLLFAPNIFILDYLKNTGQLTSSIRQQAVVYLESGYQRELTYRHNDGSFSAFGKSDASGNTWLSAFVMKSFGGARSYIFVDAGHIAATRKWLSSLQQKDGCFSSVGKLFHNEMKGGVSDQVSLTAYITAAFLELEDNAMEPVVENSLRCLKAAASAQRENLYTTALLAYTFTLAGDQEMRSQLISFLDLKASLQGGARHWVRDGASKKKLDSLEVEITSYVLLALLSGPSLPEFGLGYASTIVRWLTGQQNPYGGFSSTQDTVVALQALAKYGAATYSPEGSTTVTVTSSGGFHKDFSVTNDNRLLYQEEELSEIPGQYTLRAEGRSCVLAQISGYYNIPPPADFSAFSLSVQATPHCNMTRPQLSLLVIVSYQGRREETNMVIINIKLLSGYVVDKAFLQALQKDQTVKRVELNDGYIDVYLDALKKDEKKLLPLTLEEDQAVRNLKPAVVKVYDYYQTSDEAATEYTSACAQSDVINQL